MEKQIKTIGVLTSGGDAPGMNAAVRAVVRTGLHKGYRMIGIQRGYNGLLNGECFEMNLRSVSNIISAGGTILYTARCLEFKTKEGQDKGAEKCRELGIDALVVIGGDGSYRGARELAHRGIPMIGLPGTIDNDISCTDYTIGYDTAMNTALEMIDKLRDTTQSHDRCSVVEVMGRNAGYIALNVAIASGAMAVLLPEKEFDMQHDILDKITDSEGNVLEENEPKLTNKIELKQSTWDMVHTGMYKVCNESSYRSQMGGLKVTLAGKSGTAQVSEKLPNHGLFIGYAPYENPEVAATLIIPNGHGSSNVLDLYADLMCYYFGVPEKNASDDISGSATRTANIPDQNIQAD